MDVSEDLKTEIKDETIPMQSAVQDVCKEEPAPMQATVQDASKNDDAPDLVKKRRARRGCRGGQAKQPQSNHTVPRREWTWTAYRGWFQAAVEYRKDADRRTFRKIDLAVKEKGRPGRRERCRTSEARNTRKKLSKNKQWVKQEQDWSNEKRWNEVKWVSSTWNQADQDGRSW